MSMLILGLDTAGHGCRVVLWRDEDVLAARHEAMERGQDSRLIPLIEETLAAARCDYAAIDRIAVLRGPGSFTGLRIGLAAALGLGAALQKPVLGFNRFTLYRHTLHAPNLLVAIDSRRDEIFYQLFHGTREEPPQQDFLPVLVEKARAMNAVVSGDCLSLLDDLPVALHPLPEAEIVIAASLAATAQPDDDTFKPVPLYIRAPDVSQGPTPAIQ